MKYISLIPLIGGFPIGAEAVVGKPPEKVYSYDGFWANDSLYMNHLNKTRNLNVEYEVITNDTLPEHYDMVLVTAPCAGLSMLSKQKTASAGRCQKNEWLLRSTEDAINLFSPTVIIGENAPALYTTMGKDVAKQLEDIAEKYGYSVTFVRTNTITHGIPQSRQRTFYFLWNSKTAPILEFGENKPYEKLETFLQIEKNQNSEEIYPKITEDVSWIYLKEIGVDILQYPSTSALHVILSKEEWKEGFLQFAEEKYPEEFVKIKGRIDKLAAGGNIWDKTPMRNSETIAAVTSRNISVLHPTEERSLHLSECLKLMGLPPDYDLLEGSISSKFSKITQNVPTCTAAAIVEQGLKFINNELEMSKYNVVHQNRLKNSKIEQNKFFEKNKPVTKTFD